MIDFCCCWFFGAPNEFWLRKNDLFDMWLVSHWFSGYKQLLQLLKVRKLPPFYSKQTIKSISRTCKSPSRPQKCLPPVEHRCSSGALRLLNFQVSYISLWTHPDASQQWIFHPTRKCMSKTGLDRFCENRNVSSDEIWRDFMGEKILRVKRALPRDDDAGDAL